MRLMAKEGQDLVRFGLLNFAETYRLQDLKDIASALGLALPRTARHIDYMEALLDCKEIIGDVKKSVMELVAARLAKRSRRSKTKPVDDTGDADEAGDDENDTDKEEVLNDNPFVKSLPEEEVAFAFSEVPAGFALNEEENDEGMDAIAQAAIDDRLEQEAATPAKAATKPRIAPTSKAKPQPSARSSSSSSTLPPPLPPPVEGPLPVEGEVTDASFDVETTPGHLRSSERVVAELRMPNLAEEEAPPGCSLRCYPAARGGEGLRWQAKLPPEAEPFEGTKSKSQGFSFAESGDRAKLTCLQFLQRWHDAKLQGRL